MSTSLYCLYGGGGRRGTFAFAGEASARDQIQVAGSSTVLPYAKIVAEHFGKAYSNFKTPVVEFGGSGAGIKQFCQGLGEATIDIANASRTIKKDEMKTAPRTASRRSSRSGSAMTASSSPSTARAPIARSSPRTSTWPSPPRCRRTASWSQPQQDLEGSEPYAP